VRVALAAAVTLLAVLAAGCGSGGNTGDSSTRAATAGHVSKRCATRAAVIRRAVARIDRDIARIRAAAGTVPASQSNGGNAAVNKATDRFLLDVSTAPITNLRRNRLIDHAASALVGSCELCFQALEANRPIPAIKFPSGGACSR
jgi:hypothetical protein